MASPADDIPDLERLMREVLRLSFEREHGADWQDGLSGSMRSSIERCGDRARAKRPEEELRDGWDAVGLGEISALLRSVFPSAIAVVWPDPQTSTVDLARLTAYRNKNLHAVGPPSGQIGDQEIEGIILRLRVGFENVRRTLMDEAGDWWPYIESLHSNIPEFCLTRGAGGMLGPKAQPTLNEGDLITVEVVAVNPNGDSGKLRFRFQAGWSTQTWSESSSFSCTVPHAPSGSIGIHVADSEDMPPGWNNPFGYAGRTQGSLQFKVRPVRP